ncbi:hypothetical protein EYF80_068258 [Liparis tanakae]|uniref:Uncharacterized protein n=1 Tax=Liparis tanakae TaxID=230148 RepID=A0A4Z2DZF7_9TELE|nr:hypothetical protein EYF80_068258 [Liparis tanakae]
MRHVEGKRREEEQRIGGRKEERTRAKDTRKVRGENKSKGYEEGKRREQEQRIRGRKEERTRAKDTRKVRGGDEGNEEEELEEGGWDEALGVKGRSVPARRPDPEP